MILEICITSTTMVWEDQEMKKMLVLLFVFVAIATSVHAALIQVKLEVVSTQNLGRIRVADGDTNQQITVCQGTTPCSFTFKSGKKITLTGTTFQQPGFAFHGWGPVSGSATGACGIQATCNFTLTQDTKVTAKIDQVFNLRVQVGTGSGTIRVKSPGDPGFDCTNTAPLSCSRGFFRGSQITIENLAGPNQQFFGYASKTGSMQACTSSTCNFTLAADSSLVSNFDLIP